MDIIISTNKLTQEDWLNIEKKGINTSDLEREIHKSLIKLGGLDVQETSELILKVMGDDFYFRIRPLINKYTLGELEYVNLSKKANKKSIKKSKTADEIRFDNTVGIIENYVQNILISVSNDTESNALYSDIIEGRGICIMVHAYKINKNIEKYKKEKYIENAYETIIGIQKFLKATENYKGISKVNTQEIIPISELMRTDLKRWNEKLVEIFNIDGYKIYNSAPKLLIFTKYDQIIPNRGITPRQSQKDVMKIINENPNNYLIAYKAMINSGKTTFAATTLPAYVKKYRQINKTSKLQVIVCCNFDSVCFDVASIAYANNIKFGYATYEKEGKTRAEKLKSNTYKIKIRNHFNCTNDEDRILIIGGLDVVLRILQSDKHRMEQEKLENPFTISSSNYILFFDEITAGSDNLDSLLLKKSMELLKYIPDKTILSSATLPELSKLTNFMDVYNRIYPYHNNKIFTVISNEIHSGCDVYTFNNESVIPHNNCTNIQELQKTIKVVKEIPFLGRLYTPQVVLKMWEKNPSIDINKIFADTSNMRPDMIRQFGMSLLESIIAPSITQTDAIEDAIEINSKIKELCKVDYFDKKDNIQENIHGIKFNNLGDTEAYKFIGGITLISSINPIEEGKELFKNLIDEMKKNNLEPHKLIQQYNKEMETYNTKINKIKEKTKSDDKMQQLINELEHPEIKIPSYYQINTLSHVKKYTKDLLLKLKMTEVSEIIDINTIRTEYPTNKHPVFDIDESLLILLWCGVGIYLPENELIPEQYTSHIHDLLSTGNLAYIVSNRQIMYGSNYPIKNVIVTSEFSETCSMNSLFQLYGRAGRVRLAYKASVYIDDDTAKRIYSYIHNDDSYDKIIEIYNMNRMFEILEEEKQRKEDLEKIIQVENDQKEYNRRTTELNLLKQLNN